MRIGINTPAYNYKYDISDMARRAEELGFESIWFPEHTVMPVGAKTLYPGTEDGHIPDSMNYMVDPFMGLAAASSVTKNLLLGTGVCLVPEHNPLNLAKTIATLDYFSGGRVLFGVGTGWLEEESEIMGVNFRRRWSQTREALLAIKELWTKQESEFHGEFYDFPLVMCNPKPVQKPHPPIILGGASKNVLERVVEIGDGWIPVRHTPDEVSAARGHLNRLAESRGRDPDSIEISVFGLRPDREELKAFENAGAARVIVGLTSQETGQVINFRAEEPSINQKELRTELESVASRLSGYLG